MHGDKSSGKQWTCKVCEKSLQTKARLIQHEKSIVNLQEKVFSCEECKYSTNDKGYFADHKRRIHKSSEGLRGGHLQKTNQNQFSTIVCLWNIEKTMKMCPALSVKRLLGQRGICYVTSRMYTKKRTMTKQEIQTAHKLT